MELAIHVAEVNDTVRTGRSAADAAPGVEFPFHYAAAPVKRVEMAVTAAKIDDVLYNQRRGQIVIESPFVRQLFGGLILQLLFSALRLNPLETSVPAG
jgi:hypothetical protein